jgi:hypothetical protein
MALAAQAGMVSAQAPAGWECKLCPYPQGTSFDVDAGAVYVDSDSFKFGRYTGLEKGTYLGLDASAQSADGADYLDFQQTWVSPTDRSNWSRGAWVSSRCISATPSCPS